MQGRHEAEAAADTIRDLECEVSGLRERVAQLEAACADHESDTDAAEGVLTRLRDALDPDTLAPVLYEALRDPESHAPWRLKLTLFRARWIRALSEALPPEAFE
jgi:hypothetical protein